MLRGKPEQYIKEELDPPNEQFLAAVLASRPQLGSLPEDDPVFRGETFDTPHAIDKGLVDYLSPFFLGQLIGFRFVQQIQFLQDGLNSWKYRQSGTNQFKTTEEENSGNGPVQTISQPANGEGLVQLATAVQSLVDNMNNRAEDDIPSRTVTAASIMFTGPADRSRYLFGFENQMFSMSERWNKIAVNPASASSSVHGMKRLKGPLSVARPLLSPVHCSSVTIICTETACLTPNVWQPENSVRTTKGWIQPVWATSMWFCVRTI